MSTSWDTLTDIPDCTVDVTTTNRLVCAIFAIAKVIKKNSPETKLAGLQDIKDSIWYTAPNAMTIRWGDLERWLNHNIQPDYEGAGPNEWQKQTIAMLAARIPVHEHCGHMRSVV